MAIKDEYDRDRDVENYISHKQRMVKYIENMISSLNFT